MNEIENHEKWMLKAIKQAEKAYSCDEVPIGCVIIKDDVIIGQGYNQVEQLNIIYHLHSSSDIHALCL